MTMLTLAKIRDWLKTQVDCPNWYIGKIDGSKEHCIGIYGGAPTGPPRTALGGLENASYDIKSLTILVHWGKNADLAEQKAQEVYIALIGRTNITVGGKRVIMIRMRSSEPVSVGTDDSGIYEFVIDAYFYYER